jgi:hypothetical protein
MIGWSPGDPRPPCVECGDTRLTYHEHLTATVFVSADLESTHRVGSDVGDWQSVWGEVKNRAQAISNPREGAGGRDEIIAAAMEARAFFVTAYHLKDVLKADGVANDVENMISSSEVLKRLADVANLSKHRRLTRPPRSGVVPVFGRPHGTSWSGGDSWVFGFPIHFGDEVLDGVEFAVAVIDAWGDKLREWGLI